MNAYFHKISREGRGRSEEGAECDNLVDEKCIVASDFNVHSPVWNPRCGRKTDHRFLGYLIDAHELVVLNDGQATRPAEGKNHSVIDFTLAAPEVAKQVRGWSILAEPEAETSSDHEVIEWE